MRLIIAMFALLMGFTMDIVAQVTTTDSMFIRSSRPIEFVVNKINISDSDRRWITDTLIPRLNALGERGIIIGRATASPEGTLPNNQRLARERRESVDALLSSYGINTSRIRYDVVAEDYPLLRSLMYLEHDDRLAAVDSILARYPNNDYGLRNAMRSHDGGRLWRYVLGRYFHKLRAVRIMAIDRSLVDLYDKSLFTPLSLADLLPARQRYVAPAEVQTAFVFPAMRHARRELLSVKTNLLYDFAYMPGYDRFCPIPNVAIEYYPLHGHFTYGASFEGPWWQHYDDHKYFQVRNYQVHTRYYFRSGDIGLRPPGKGAAFKGWYVSAYAHAGLYNICFDADRGWEGEGYGAGLGIGYVTTLSRNEHWRLEFGMQAGFFSTKYDPYQWLCPIDPDSDVRQYYYKWYGEAKDFQKRQYRYNWLGPTRIEVTLSYDLLYRK